MISKKRASALSILITVLAFAVASVHAAVNLKTEFMDNPLGIDTVKPRFSWIVEDATPGAKQTAYQIQASASPEKLAKGEADLWDSGKVDSNQSNLVEYAGKPLVSRQEVWWRVKSWDKDGKDTGWSQLGRFEVGLLGSSDWASAEWISAPRFPEDESEVSTRWFDAALITEPVKGGTYSNDAIESSRQDLAKTTGSALLRKQFNLPAGVVRARLYLSTLGFHEITLNGRDIDDHRMEPAPVHAPLFSYYVVKDVTGLLKEGDNCLGLTLSNGRHVEGPRHHVMKDYGDRPATKALLVADLSDGSQLEIVSDASWKASPGPIVRDSFWVGEAVDATRIPDGWDRAGFDDASWQSAEKADCVLPPKTIFQAFPPGRVVRRVKPVAMLNPVPGVWVFDMGEEIVGNTELKVTVPRGTLMTLRYAGDIYGVRPEPFYRLRYSVSGYPLEEARRKGMLAPQDRGTVFPTRRIPIGPDKRYDHKAVGMAVCTDVFRAAGGREEVFERKFGYRPFRYVELTGYPGTPTLDTLTGLVTHDDVAATGSFACSNPLLNEIEEASARTLRYMLQGMQLDNSGGEKGHYPHMLALNYGIHAYRHDVAAFTSRILSEMRDYSGPHHAFDSRLKDAPSTSSKRVSISESQFYTELPWQFYLYYGDRRELETNYPLMRDFIGFWFENPKVPSLILDDAFGDHNGWTTAYGLPQYWKNPSLWAGCLVPHLVPKDFYGTTTGLKFTGTALQAARILNRDEDATQLEKLRGEIRTAARDKFRDPTSGVYCAGAPTMQGINALAVWSGLAEKSEYGPLVEGIVEDMREKWNGHISTGSRASYPLLAVLTENGRVDDAYEIMARTNYPSLGHMLSFGSKTIAEAWAYPDYPTDASRTQAEGYTQMTRWFYEWLCGVKPDPAAPGFKHFFITPYIPKDLASAGMEFQSPYGRIATAWQQDGDKLRLTVEVPWNTTATVQVPGFRPVSVNGQPQEKSEFNLPAGKWEIVAMQNQETK
jgi:alpha-L-rhamnosidase